eukprot:scaffold115974_cov63-Phaeocystis_antarctica.AAC.3
MGAAGMAPVGVAAKGARGEEVEEASEEADDRTLDEEAVLVLVSEGGAQRGAQGRRQVATTGGAAAAMPGWSCWKLFPRLYEVQAAGRNGAAIVHGCDGACGPGGTKPAGWRSTPGAFAVSERA